MSPKIHKEERMTERRHLQSGKQLKGGDIPRCDERYAEEAKAIWVLGATWTTVSQRVSLDERASLL